MARDCIFSALALPSGWLSRSKTFLHSLGQKRTLAMSLVCWGQSRAQRWSGWYLIVRNLRAVDVSSPEAQGLGKVPVIPKPSPTGSRP